MMRRGFVALVAFGLAMIALSQLAAADTMPLPAPFDDPAPSTVSIGSLIGPWIEIAFLVLGSPIALGLAGLFVRLAGMLGVTIEEARRQRLQEIIQRGLMLAAQQAHSRLDGKLPMASRSALVEEAAAYTTRYGRQTLKRLGQNPADLAAVREIVNARLAEMAPLAPGAERG